MSTTESPLTNSISEFFLTVWRACQCATKSYSITGSLPSQRYPAHPRHQQYIPSLRPRPARGCSGYRKPMRRTVSRNSGLCVGSILTLTHVKSTHHLPITSQLDEDDLVDRQAHQVQRLVDGVGAGNVVHIRHSASIAVGASTCDCDAAAVAIPECDD